MVGRARVPHPSQRLRQRTVWIRCLPTTHEIELVGQAVEYVTLATQKSDWIARPPISDSDVEVTTQYEIGMVSKQGDTIENVLHCAHVSAFTDGSVNAEHY